MTCARVTVAEALLSPGHDVWCPVKAPTFAGLAPGACFYWHRGGPLCVKLGPGRWSPVGGLQHRLRDVQP